MFHSIRIQLLTVLIIMIGLILVQGFLGRANEQVLTEGMNNTRQAVIDVGIVGELERDVVDLQRNVLIFRETASPSAVTRFERLMISITDKLEALQPMNTQKMTFWSACVLTWCLIKRTSMR